MIDIKIDYTDLTESQVVKITNDINSQVENGEANALHYYLAAKLLSSLGASLKDKLYSAAWEEAQKYSKDERSMYGATYEETSTGATYNFKEDSEWARLKGLLQEREKLIKRAIKAPEDEPVLKGDEVIQPVSIKSPSKANMSVSLKKLPKQE